MLTYQRGSTGQFVKLIQSALGIVPVDGDFGPITEREVKAFQNIQGLDANGIVGFKTWSAMGLNTLTESFQSIQFTLTPKKIQQADMNDIPKLVNALLPLYKNNFHVKEHLTKGLELGLNYEKQFHLDTPENLAHFFGQIREEVGNSFSTRESLNYSCNGLKIFGFYKKNGELAQQHGRCNSHPANQEAIANHAYANRIGNGEAESGDGWKYIGRGCKQLTGRANYQEFQDYMDEHFPEITQDFMENPELIEQPGYSLISAAVFWHRKRLDKAAREGVTELASNEVTKIVNYHTGSYPDRWKHTQKAAKLMGIA